LGNWRVMNPRDFMHKFGGKIEQMQRITESSRQECFKILDKIIDLLADFTVAPLKIMKEENIEVGLEEVFAAMLGTLEGLEKVKSDALLPGLGPRVLRKAKEAGLID